MFIGFTLLELPCGGKRLTRIAKYIQAEDLRKAIGVVSGVPSHEHPKKPCQTRAVLRQLKTAGIAKNTNHPNSIPVQDNAE